MNIGGDQIRGALFNCFVVKNCPSFIFWMLPSVSKITTASNDLKTSYVIKLDLPKSFSKIREAPTSAVHN